MPIEERIRVKRNLNKPDTAFAPINAFGSFCWGFYCVFPNKLQASLSNKVHTEKSRARFQISPLQPTLPRLFSFTPLVLTPLLDSYMVCSYNLSSTVHFPHCFTSLRYTIVLSLL